MDLKQNWTMFRVCVEIQTAPIMEETSDFDN